MTVNKMTNPQPVDKYQLLTDLPPYIYGTTRLGDQNLPFEDRVQVARAAMEGTTWFHTSHTYGNALQVLRAAFDQDGRHIPKLIVKIGWKNIEELRDVVHQHLIALRLESLDLGQLCLSDSLAEEYASGGGVYEEFSRLKHQ